jgi:hypothetical protein
MRLMSARRKGQIMRIGTSRKCQSVKASGRKCGANAMTGSTFCFFHNPTKEAEREAARRSGGLERNRRVAVLPPGTPDRQVLKISDVIELLGETVNQVRRGQLDPKVANSVGYIAGILIKALERGPLEDRIALLEALLKKQRSGLGPPARPDAPDRSFSFENQNRGD